MCIWLYGQIVVEQIHSLHHVIRCQMAVPQRHGWALMSEEPRFLLEPLPDSSRDLPILPPPLWKHNEFLEWPLASYVFPILTSAKW